MCFKSNTKILNKHTPALPQFGEQVYEIKKIWLILSSN